MPNLYAIHAENGDGEDLGFDVEAKTAVEALTEWIDHYGLDDDDEPLTMPRLRVSVPELRVVLLQPGKTPLRTTLGKWLYWTEGRYVDCPFLEDLLCQTGRVERLDA